MSREFLERMTVIDVPPTSTRAPATLEALFHMPMAFDDEDGTAVPALLLPGVPGVGGSMDHAVLAEAAWAISQRGAATMRINYEGVGASSKTNPVPLWFDLDDVAPSEVTSRVKDCCANAAVALAHLKASTNATPVVVGYAFGALVVAALLQSEANSIERAVLIAPPMTSSAWDPAALVATGIEIDLLLPASDPLSPEETRDAARTAGLWPKVIADADRNFVRGLSALGQELVRRGWPQSP